MRARIRMDRVTTGRLWHVAWRSNDGGKPSRGLPHVMKCRDVRDEVGGHDRGRFRRCKSTHTHDVSQWRRWNEMRRGSLDFEKLGLASSF